MSTFKDSEIIDLNEQDLNNNSNEVFELVHTTSHSMLYRMRKDGKYFIVKKGALTNDNGRKILRREYEISIGLSHPHIVDIYEYRYDENFQDSIIMEYVEGRTLNDFLAESPAIKTKRRIFSELLDAIEYLHKNRIIHNDLKPENIIISRTGDQVKLIDLGLSDDDVHYAFKSIGFTKGFSAPELIEKGKSDVRSDIYSIGVLMRLLFGKKYRGLIKKCTAAKPEKRFSDIAELRKRLNRYYLRWLIPLIFFLVVALLFISVLILREWHSQKEEREILKNEISLQDRELKKQKESFLALQNRYETLDDSIKMARRIYQEKERDKKEAIDNFSAKLTKMTALTIDSLRKNPEYFYMNARKYHYNIKATKLYENQNKIIQGEDLTNQFYTIFITEKEKVENEYNGLLGDL